MKGLLIKDFKLLKNQKQFFLIIGLITFMFLVTNDSPYFTITYATMMFSMFTMSTISYDEYDNGAAYLFSLPISRKGYVAEKYFGIADITGAYAAGIILCNLKDGEISKDYYEELIQTRKKYKEEKMKESDV